MDVLSYSSERMISHLSTEVDFLQLKNRDLERKLVEMQIAAEEAADKFSHAKARNLELEGQLLEVDQVAAKLQVDKDVVVRAADREMGEAKNELEKSRHELEDMENTIVQLKTENKQLTKECSEMKSRLTVRETDNHKMDNLLDCMQEEKKRLIQRNNKALANEKELVLEIERLKRKNGPAVKKGKIPTKLDVFIRSIEEDRDYYRQQTDTLQKMLMGEPGVVPVSKPSSRPSSPVRDAKSAVATKKALAQQEAVIRVLEEEKDYYKKEYEALKSLRRSSTPVRSTPTKSAKEESELFRLTRERDELKALLDKFERHMAEIQANVSVLTAERDKLNNMYKETKEELMHVRRELISSPKSPKTSLAAQAVLRRVENEREDAISDVRRLTTERDSLRERIKGPKCFCRRREPKCFCRNHGGGIATESSLSERAKLEQQVEDLQSSALRLQSEREELLARLTGQKNDLKAYEEQTKEQSLRLNQMDEELARAKASSAQLRVVLEDAEKSLDETRHRLARRDKEVQKKDERCAALEDELALAQHSLSVQRDEMSALRNTLATVDREKDVLQVSVDEKAQKVAILNAELHDRELLWSDLKVRVGELEAQLLHSNDSLSLKDREIKSLRRQVDSVTEDLKETSRGRDIYMQENRRMQDDITVLSKENQKLSAELHEALSDKDNLKGKVQQYILEVQRVEDLLANKEAERSDLLEQYRKLSLEAEQYQTTAHQLESEGSNLRLEILTKESELRRAHDKIDNLEREIQEHLLSQQSYEQQVVCLTRSITTLEETLRQAEDDKCVLRADYTAAKESSAKLDSVKEQLQRKQAAILMEKEQLQSLVEDLQQESACLQEQVDAERATVKNLEALLQNNREKDFQSQLQSQERNTEIQMLRDRLSLNESKLQSQAREVASLRTRNVELEGDVERLRRQLTNERFERERAVQELRRNGITPPMMISEYTSSETYSRHSSGDRGRSSSRSRSRSPPRYRPGSSSRPKSPERLSYESEYTSVKTYSHDII